MSHCRNIHEGKLTPVLKRAAYGSHGQILKNNEIQSLKQRFSFHIERGCSVSRYSQKELQLDVNWNVCLPHLMISVGAIDFLQTLARNQFWLLTGRLSKRKEETQVEYASSFSDQKNKCICTQVCPSQLNYYCFKPTHHLCQRHMQRTACKIWPSLKTRTCLIQVSRHLPITAWT